MLLSRGSEALAKLDLDSRLGAQRPGASRMWKDKSVQAGVSRFETDARFTSEPAVGFEGATC